MKLQALDYSSKKPVSNYKFQIQIKGSYSGYLTLNTDANGYFELDDKYKNQQIAYLSQGAVAGSYVTAQDGAKFYISAKQPVTGNKEYTTTQSYK